MAIGRKASENRILAVIDDRLRAFVTVVLVELRQRLDDRHQRDTTGAARAEQCLHVKGGHGAKLITVENNTVGQAPAAFFRQLKQLFG